MPIWERMRRLRDYREARLKKITYERLLKRFGSMGVANEFQEAFLTFCNGFDSTRIQNTDVYNSINFKTIKRLQKEFEVLWRKAKHNQTHTKIAAAVGLKVHDITHLLKKFKTGVWLKESLTGCPKRGRKTILTDNMSTCIEKILIKYEGDITFKGIKNR